MAQSLNLLHLATFADVAALGSFSAAAEKAGISQPAVSQQVRQLERHFGVRLLERVGKRVRPTEAGQIVIEGARRIGEELDAVRAAVEPHRDGRAGRVRIGTGATACIHLLPPVLGRLKRAFPGLDFVVRTGNSTEIQRLLEQNLLDLAIVTLPAAGRALETSPLCDEALLAVGPAATAGAPTTPQAMAARPLILYDSAGHTRGLIDGWFRAAGLRPAPIMELESVEAAKELVAAGLGWSILPASSVARPGASGGLAVQPLDPPLGRQLALQLRRDKRLSPGLRHTVAAIRKGLGRVVPLRAP
ncbi:LysR family transcriptional regulator [Rhodovulum sp. BSW8]|uniref:LysR family transcriptional regulator n=1 Tax=Rhodovulum sp. BSW8 TaxID=2259645 RepID=UPI000DE51618|nr:LysR family transcriptional regulator [Rhodovulum sp. BSW8]RBO51165.1 LysR family transcriptional regulator [Rhodovulum sp. BSW8]